MVNQWFFIQQFITEFQRKLISYLILISFFDEYDTTKPTIKMLLDDLIILKQTKYKSNLDAIKLVKSKIKELTCMREEIKNEADCIIKNVIDNVGVNLKRHKHILISEFVNFIEIQIIEIMGYNSSYKWSDIQSHPCYCEWYYVKNRLINSFAKNIYIL